MIRYIIISVFWVSVYVRARLTELGASERGNWQTNDDIIRARVSAPLNDDIHHISSLLALQLPVTLYLVEARLGKIMCVVIFIWPVICLFTPRAFGLCHLRSSFQFPHR